MHAAVIYLQNIKVPKKLVLKYVIDKTNIVQLLVFYCKITINWFISITTDDSK